MFRRRPSDAAATVTLTVDGETVSVRPGESVAAALLLAGRTQTRATAVSGAPRGPYCMMGVCFECLVSIDGVGNRQACMVEVKDGMRVERQMGVRRIGAA